MVGYPIVGVNDVLAHLRRIEAAIVAALAQDGISARSRSQEGPDWTGVWVADRKIASLGVHLSRGVSTHGFAVNVVNDLSPFEWIVPCGLSGVRMTSLASEIGEAADLDRLSAHVVERLRGPSGVPRQISRSGRARAPRRCRGGGMSATRSRANPGGMDVLKVLGPEVRPLRERKPPWFKVPAPGGQRYRALTEMIKAENLHTVCQEAACPNVGECWERGTATFMILGDTCTRRCGFCNVKTGKPTWNDPLEPARVAGRLRAWACATP